MRLSVMESLRWAFQFGSWKPTRSEWMLAAQCVQQEEKERIGKFVFTKDGKAAMAGRLLMRKAISDTLQIPWNEIRLARTDRGKPFLLNSVANICPHFNFNVSHQGDYAVLAAEPVLQVGVDVMKVEQPNRTNVPEFFHTMRKQFTTLEWKTIKAPSDEWKQLERFYRYWCLKESYIKAVGIGLGYDLLRIEFHVKSPELHQDNIDQDTVVYVDNKLDQSWRFQETILNNNHIVTVALWNKSLEGVSETQFVNQDSADVRGNHENQPFSHYRTLEFTELVSTAQPLLPADEDYWETFNKKDERYPPVKK
ncbi:L-aminoadipate-semialdehyde dehydrogenase-phosphopantetheinyl transferase-like [Glandiceps talaboti]